MPRAANPTPTSAPWLEAQKAFYTRTPKKAREKKPRTTGSRERKARIRQMVRDYGSADWKQALAYFQNKCAYCDAGGHLQQEHFLPVRLGGHYVPGNIVPACSPCNGKKSDKDPLEWLLSRAGGLVVYARIMQFFETVRLVE
jgi:5-methylcytosine-specific restriction endonuclease McrA